MCRGVKAERLPRPQRHAGVIRRADLSKTACNHAICESQGFNGATHRPETGCWSEFVLTVPDKRTGERAVGVVSTACGQPGFVRSKRM